MPRFIKTIMQFLTSTSITITLLSHLVSAYSILPTTDASGARVYDLDELNFELKESYDKPRVNDSNFDVGKELLKVLPAHQPTNISLWEAGVLPSNCLGYFKLDGRPVEKKDFAVYNVTYGDCHAPWVFCQHTGSNTSIEKMTEAFGRLPIAMREHVRTVAALPEPLLGDRTAAFSLDNDIAVRPCCWDLHTLSHEASHIIDSKLPTAQGHNPYVGRPGALARRYGWRPAPLPEATTTHGALGGQAEKYSDSLRWRAAEEEDQCVLSQYALTNWAEHFAETSGVGLLEVFGGAGTVQRLSPTAGQGLKSQIGLWVKDWGRVVRGGPWTCEERVRPVQVGSVIV